MIIFNEDTDEGFAKVTNKTKTVFISLFGFYPHDKVEDLEIFFTKELKVSMDEDSKAALKAIEVYECFDRRRSDLGHVLTIPFKNKKEAKAFIDSKIKASKCVNSKDFSEIEFIDGDVFKDLVKSLEDEETLEMDTKKLLVDELREFYVSLNVKYPKNKRLQELAKELIDKAKED